MNLTLFRQAARLIVVLSLAAACTPAQAPTETAPPPTEAPTRVPPTATLPPPTPTAAPPTDTATAPPPTSTATDVPPTVTETPVPDPVAVHADQVAADGCPVVELHPEVWAPMFAAYKGGGDPFFHFHTNDEAFFFNVELYTVYGARWTGQLGTFDTDCATHGICVYLAPVAEQIYLATEGEIEVVALAQSGGALDYPVDLVLRSLTLEPAPGSGSTGCYHVEEVRLLIEES